MEEERKSETTNTCYGFYYEDKHGENQEVKNMPLESCKKLTKGMLNIPEVRDILPKNYLGDVRWVIYKIVCDMNADKFVSIRCGKYAFDKIKKLNDTVVGYSYFSWNLNGEYIRVNLCDEFEREKLIISKDVNVDEYMYDRTIYPDDIVLYFA